MRRRGSVNLKEKSTMLSLRIEESVMAQLEAEAAKADRAVGWLAREFIKRGLADYVKRIGDATGGGQ